MPGADSPFFTLRLVPGDLSWWSWDSPVAEELWLPVVGPTSWCLLRLFHRELSALPHGAEHPRRIHYRYADVGAQLGLTPSKARSTVMRLDRFALIVASSESAWGGEGAGPLWDMTWKVRPLPPHRFRRLPATLQAKPSARKAMGLEP